MTAADEDRVVAGRYEIVATLGSGGHGSVHRAVDRETGTHVALKLLGKPIDPAIESRFRREAKAAQAVDHPGCVRVLDSGEDVEARILYIAMELIEGESLDLVLERAGGKFDVERSVEIVLEVLDALDAAHRAGVIHRDLKPANIIMVGDTVKVCDFGSAKVLRRNVTNLTRPGMVIGTGQYMAPEQARGLECDARADLYAVGAMLFELITGRPATRPTDRTDDDRLDSIFAHALADEREDRFFSAAEMTEALQAAINATVINEPPPPKQRGVPIAAALFGIAGFAAISAFAFMVVRSGAKLNRPIELASAVREICAVSGTGEAEFVADRPLDVYVNGELIGRTPTSVRAFATGPLDVETVNPRTKKRKKMRLVIEADTRRIFELTKL